MKVAVKMYEINEMIKSNSIVNFCPKNMRNWFHAFLLTEKYILTLWMKYWSHDWNLRDILQNTMLLLSVFELLSFFERLQSWTKYIVKITKFYIIVH